MRQTRYRLKSDEVEIIEQYRAIKKESNSLGLDDKDVKHGWIKSKQASLFFKNPNFNGQQDKFSEFKDELLGEMAKHSPSYPTITRTQSEEGHLLVIDPADIHIGKLCDAFETGEDYNSQIAVQRVLEGVQGILDKSAGFHIDKILFVGGNDILHIDTPRRTTTSGTPQDTDGMWYRNFLTAKQLYVDLLEKLIALADVHFVFNPSNHDYTHGFFLAVKTIKVLLLNHCAHHQEQIAGITETDISTLRKLSKDFYTIKNTDKSHVYPTSFNIFASPAIIHSVRASLIGGFFV